MNQPFVVIAVTNTGAICTIDGYPGLGISGVVGFHGTGPDKALPATVSRGSDFERTDPGPQLITLRTGAAASFAVGTTLNLEQPYTITELAVTPPNGYTQVSLPVTFDTSANPGKPISLITTAFTSGRTGPAVQ